MNIRLNREIWEKHYTRDKSKLVFPDENVVRYVIQLFSNLQKNPVTLDLGCGSGRHLRMLRSYPGNHFGQDYSLHGAGMTPDVVCALAQELPYADCTFDFILCWGVLHYLEQEDMQQAINEIFRVLKKSASVFLTLRADDDTHLAYTVSRTGDLSGGKVKLFSAKEVQLLFQKFSTTRTGHISRIPLGEKYKVTHYMVEAVK